MRQRWRSDSPLWVASAAVGTGIASYALLAVVARATSRVGYDHFSFYWSAALVVGIGLFLPLEQVVARRRVASRDGGALLGSALRHGALAGTVALGVVGLSLATPVAPAGLDSTAFAAAFGLTIVGYTLQFTARGALAGTHRMRDYALVVTTDGTVRLVAAAVGATLSLHDPGLYMGAVGASAFVAGGLGLWLAARARDTHEADSSGVRVQGSLGREALGLSGAMILMQLLLNSPVLIAGHLRDPGVSAGLLLAVTALARIPVFLAQAAQATYVSRIAAAVHANRRQQAKRIIEVITAAALSVGGLTVLAATVLGPWLVALLFGRGFSASRLECCLCGLGVAAYLCASIANDISVSLDRHRAAVRNWFLGSVVGAVALSVSGGLMRATLPLIVGAGTTAVLIAASAAKGRVRC